MNTIKFSKSSFEIGNLTISGLSPGDLPALVAGEGLGNAKISPASSIDRFMYFPAGSLSSSVDDREGILIKTTSKITEIAIQPNFTILGLNDPTKLKFSIGYSLLGTSSTQTVHYLDLDPAIPGNVLIRLQPDSQPTELRMEVTSDDPMSLFFTNYLKAHKTQSVGFLFGFTIKSIKTM